MEAIKYLLENEFGGNKARMLRIVSDGLEKAKKNNDIRLINLIEADLKLIKEL